MVQNKNIESNTTLTCISLTIFIVYHSKASEGFNSLQIFQETNRKVQSEASDPTHHKFLPSKD